MNRLAEQGLAPQLRAPEHSEQKRELTIWLCWECGNYEPLTSEDYEGGLTGECSICEKRRREVHRFSAQIDVAGFDCSCWGGHERRTAA